MESKLIEITNKIYNEGIEKSNKEGAEIIAKAKNEAENIVNRAKNEAENIVKDAQREAAGLKAKVGLELKMAGSQSVTTLKQEITNLISNKVLSDSIKNSLEDVEFIKALIKLVVEKWSSDSKSMDLNLTLPEKNKDELYNFFKIKAVDVMKNGVELNFDSRMENGFKIGPKDKSFVLSFTDKDFLQFFTSFLRPKIKEMLFTGE